MLGLSLAKWETNNDKIIDDTRKGSSDKIEKTVNTKEESKTNKAHTDKKMFLIQKVNK